MQLRESGVLSYATLVVFGSPFTIPLFCRLRCYAACGRRPVDRSCQSSLTNIPSFRPPWLLFLSLCLMTADWTQWLVRSPWTYTVTERPTSSTKYFRLRTQLLSSSSPTSHIRCLFLSPAFARATAEETGRCMQTLRFTLHSGGRSVIFDHLHSPLSFPPQPFRFPPRRSRSTSTSGTSTSTESPELSTL